MTFVRGQLVYYVGDCPEWRGQLLRVLAAFDGHCVVSRGADVPARPGPAERYFVGNHVLATQQQK